MAYIEIIVHSHHRRITASALTLDFYNSKLPVFGGFTRVKATEMFSDGIKNFRGTLKHARCRSANLHEVSPYWFPARSIILVRSMRKYKDVVDCTD